jgi:hypothetical protein
VVHNIAATHTLPRCGTDLFNLVAALLRRVLCNFAVVIDTLQARTTETQRAQEFAQRLKLRRNNNMNIKRWSSILFTTLFLLSLESSALACACCSNDGEYSRSTAKIRDYELELIKQIRFGNQASLFITERDLEEDSRGIVDPKLEYSMSDSLAGRIWRLLFKDNSRSGGLNLTLPSLMERLSVDLQDGQKSAGGGPLLYKEWRLQGLVSGSGFFRAGIVGPTRYNLILQGRGNGCDNAEDFKSWRLEVSGKKAQYAFYGKLGKPN